MIKRVLSLLFVLIFFQTFAQKNPCFCEQDTLMNQNTVSCDTTHLLNKSKLFWQFDCNSIWLTLENKKGAKFKINEVPVELSSYTHRLGFHLIKEYKNSLLFRSGCSANGPCYYSLIDKNNGKKIKEFGQLICTDTGTHSYNFDFVVYFSNSGKELIIYNIESKRITKIPFKDKLVYIIPENQFEKMTLKNNLLTLFYTIDEHKKSLKINLKGK